MMHEKRGLAAVRGLLVPVAAAAVLGIASVIDFNAVLLSDGIVQSGAGTG